MTVNHRTKWYLSLFRHYALSVALCAGAPTLAAAERWAVPEVLGTLDGEPIRVEDVSEAVGLKLYRLQTDMYMLLKQETEALVDTHLLAREAARRGVTEEQLLHAEVTAQVAPVTEQNVEAYLAEHPAEAARPELRPRIRTYLGERAVIQRRLDFLRELRAAADYTFLLDEPPRPRVRIDLSGAPARGDPNAPITVVHFASFTCGRCAQSAMDIQRLMAEFPEQIYWVHLNFFNMFEELALRAAELAIEAQDQGRFWEFHDAMYAAGEEVETGRLAEVIAALGLDETAIDRGETLHRVKVDIDRGTKAGVNSVPSLFVNGRFFSGVYGYDRLRALVTEELGASSRADSTAKP